MSEITKDPTLGTDTSFDDNTKKLAETIQELNSVIADVNADDTDAFSNATPPSSSDPFLNPVKSSVPSPERPSAPTPVQQPYHSSMPQTAAPQMTMPRPAPQMSAPQPQYTQPPMQQPSYQPYPGSPAPAPMPYPQQSAPGMQADTKFCKFCAARIPTDAVICTACGRQVEQLAQTAQQPVIINNTNLNNNNNVNNNAVAGAKPLNKWTAFLLCLFLGYLGIHKFYEGRILSGFLYMFTGGLFGIGWLIDTLILLCKPNPYYIK